MSMVKALEFKEAISIIDSILHSCFELFEKQNAHLTQVEVDNIERVNFNLQGNCDNLFIREVVVFMKQPHMTKAPVLWERSFKNKYVVSKIILVGPWECLDLFLEVAQRKDNNVIYFQLDGMDEGLFSEAES